MSFDAVNVLRMLQKGHSYVLKFNRSMSISRYITGYNTETFPLIQNSVVSRCVCCSALPKSESRSAFIASSKNVEPLSRVYQVLNYKVPFTDTEIELAKDKINECIRIHDQETKTNVKDVLSDLKNLLGFNKLTTAKVHQMMQDSDDQKLDKLEYLLDVDGISIKRLERAICKVLNTTGDSPKEVSMSPKMSRSKKSITSSVMKKLYHPDITEIKLLENGISHDSIIIGLKFLPTGLAYVSLNSRGFITQYGFSPCDYLESNIRSFISQTAGDIVNSIDEVINRFSEFKQIIFVVEDDTWHKIISSSPNNHRKDKIFNIHKAYEAMSISILNEKCSNSQTNKGKITCLQMISMKAKLIQNVFKIQMYRQERMNVSSTLMRCLEEEMCNMEPHLNEQFQTLEYTVKDDLSECALMCIAVRSLCDDMIDERRRPEKPH